MKPSRLEIEGFILTVLAWGCIGVLVLSPFLLLFFAKEPTECLVRTTERGNRLHIVLDCPTIPSSAQAASTDEK